jgi:hypothetical protein
LSSRAKRGISESEAREMRELARSIARDVRAWLIETHADLLSRGD